MAGWMVCPQCQSTVVPWRDAQGQLHCPACNDTGVVQAQPAWGHPAAPSGSAPTTYSPAARNADGAVLTLVFGILALAVPYAGLVFGTLALVFGKKASVAIAASGGALQGQGLVSAGKVLGVIGCVLWGTALLIAGSAVVFVLVSNLESPDVGEVPPEVSFSREDSGTGGRITVIRAEAGLDWSDLEVTGSAGCVAPFGSVEGGDAIDCPRAGSVEVIHLPTNTLVYATMLDD